MLTRADAELGFPQLHRQNMGAEHWSQDFGYQADGFSNSTGTDALLETMPTEAEARSALNVAMNGSSSNNVFTQTQVKWSIKILERGLRQIPKALAGARTNLANAREEWKACADSSCKPRHSKSKCNTCRANPSAMIASSNKSIKTYSNWKSQFPDFITKLKALLTIAPTAPTSSTPNIIDDSKTSSGGKKKIPTPVIIGIGLAVLVGGYFLYRKLRK